MNILNRYTTPFIIAGLMHASVSHATDIYSDEVFNVLAENCGTQKVLLTKPKQLSGKVGKETFLYVQELLQGAIGYVQESIAMNNITQLKTDCNHLKGLGEIHNKLDKPGYYREHVDEEINTISKLLIDNSVVSAR